MPGMNGEDQTGEHYAPHLNQKSDRVDRSAEQLWRGRKAFVSKGIQQAIDKAMAAAHNNCQAKMTSNDLLGQKVMQEEADKAKQELVEKVAYIQEENRRMKAELDRQGIKLDIYPIRTK